jgi:hypothetical protein
MMANGRRLTEGSSFQYTLWTSALEQFLPVPVIQLLGVLVLGWRVFLDFGLDQKLRNAVEFIDCIKREGGDEEAIARHHLCNLGRERLCFMSKLTTTITTTMRWQKNYLTNSDTVEIDKEAFNRISFSMM